MSWVDDLRHDAAGALRGLVTASGFAAAALLTLALGIGATSAIFSVVNALLLRPLSYAPFADRLVRLNALVPDAADPAASPRRQPVVLSADEAGALAATGVFDGAGIVAPTVMSIRGVENAGHVGAVRLSASALALLDARPLLGRALTPADETADGEVALLGFAAWQRLFAGDPAVVGRTLTLQTVLGPRASRPVTVIGVMPASFTFPAADTGLWMPPERGARQPLRGRLLARLAPGTSLVAARDAVAPLVRTMREHGREVRYEVVSEGAELVRTVRPALLVLASAVAVLLFIACLNVANLLVARALSRSRELSIRAALGASRGRLARQCLTESAVLGVLGGAGGLAVAVATLAAFRRFATPLPRIDLGTTGVGWGPTVFPRLDEIGLDGTVLAVTAATAVAVGLAVGLGAAFHAARAHVFGAVRVAGATGTGGRRTGIARRALVVLQVAGATTLLVGAVLLTRSLRHLLDTDPGYAAADVLTFQVALPAATYPDARLQAFAETMAERLRGVPGVVAAGYANQLPMVALRDTAGGLWTTPDGTRRGKPDGEDARFVSRDYLATLGIPVVAGRGFTAGDGAGQPRVLLVNQALARRAFADRDPIGLTVYVGRDTAPWTIVGVVSDVRQFGLDRPPEPQFFADLRQWSGGMPLFPTGAYFAVKTRGRPAAVVPEIRAIVRALDPGGALFNVAGMDDIVASTVTRPRLYAVLIGRVAALGALLSAIGVYGVLAYLVEQRSAEFGIRMALGASRAVVLAMVVRQGGALVAAGLLIGAAGAAGLARALEALLYGVGPWDATAFVVAAMLFATVAAVAVLLPARQATRVDPLAAIRCE